MSKTITLKRDDLKGIIRMAIKMGSMNLGAKQDRLVKAVFEEAEEKAEDVIIRMPIRFDMSAEGLELIKTKAGCVVPKSEVNIIGGDDTHKMVNVEITADVCESKLDMMKSRTNRFDENELKQGEVEYLLRRRAVSHVTPDLPKTARETRAMSAERAAFLLWMNDIARVPGEKPACDLNEARRRQAVASATMLELELAERQGKLISIEEADRRVLEERKKLPAVDVIDLDDGTTAVSIVIGSAHPHPPAR